MILRLLQQQDKNESIDEEICNSQDRSLKELTPL